MSGGSEHFDKLWLVRQEVLEPHDLLLQAKALVLCALPYKRTDAPRISRRARTGKRSWLKVTFAALDEDVVLPYGADRAVLGWIQTKAFVDGFIQYKRLKEFLTDFRMNDSGRNYSVFRERVNRLSNMAVSIKGSTEDETFIENITPIKRAFFPNTPREARRRITDEDTGQLLMIPQRYGFQLDPDFWTYLKSNPVPLPLPLMRAFRSRPKFWDFAQFVIYRCFAAKTESVIPWAAFEEQLGSTDTDTRRLRHTLRRCLAEIKVVYPDLPAAFLEGAQGLRVAPWEPPRPRG